MIVPDINEIRNSKIKLPELAHNIIYLNSNELIPSTINAVIISGFIVSEKYSLKFIE